MPANLENSAMNTGLEKVNFHYNPKEGQCQRMFKLLLNCTHLSSVQFSSVTQLSLTLCDPVYCSTPGFPVHHQLLELAQTHVHLVGMPSNHLILCCPFLLPSTFPSIRVFSSESVLHIRWPKYWSFSFNISPSNEFRTDFL